jgi:F plasmid transfer operon, TraF, protein
MRRTPNGVRAALAALFTALPVAAAAQTFDTIGTRALGMGGAFVAVANDATATYWNPAGLAGGDPFGVTIGWTRLQSGNQTGPPAPGPWAQDSSYYAVGTWPLGASYGRIRTTQIVQRPTGLMTTSLETRQYGGTILQSVTQGLVLGTTLKYVRGSVATANAAGLTAGDAIDTGKKADADSSGAFDFDVGMMLDMERVRLGLTARNLREPTFGLIAETPIQLRRQVRAGVAVLPSAGVTLAMDVDLDTVDLRGDLRRIIALGGEAHAGRRLAFRGGVRWDLEGDHRPVGTLGMSFALSAGTWLEGFVMRGRLDEDRGFGFGLRAAK